MRAIVSLSGGMDSATVLATAIHEEREVQAVGFCYGSKHNPYENESAERLSKHFRVPYRLIDLNSVGKYFSSNLMVDGGEIPEGHYEDESMSQTVVPSRNIIFASILSGIAWSEGASEVWLGIHSGDHAIYPDCRPEFFLAMKLAIEIGTEGRVTLRAPFLEVSKAEILAGGLGLEVPYEMTRTCYKDQPLACGKCGACQERLEAFKINRVKDPVEYAK